jgi:hypothetical protein
MNSKNKNYKFKADENDISLDSRDAVKIINIAMTQQTSRNIDILSHHFDPGVFDTPDFIEAVKQLAISSKFTKIRVLIKDSEPMTKNGHRIIDLIQLLTSSIEVRKIAEEYKSYNEAFALFDKKRVIYLRYADRYNGFANFDRPRLATELSNLFNEIWDHSVPDENLRRLYL